MDLNKILVALDHMVQWNQILKNFKEDADFSNKGIILEYHVCKATSLEHCKYCFWLVPENQYWIRLLIPQIDIIQYSYNQCMLTYVYISKIERFILQVLVVLAVISVTCLVAILSADCIQQQIDNWRTKRPKNIAYV